LRRAELFIVARVDVVAGDAFSAAVSVAEGEKCPRCWNIRELGVDAERPEVCARCAGVLGSLG
jgi:isoleucyl-tRNA synthetase